MLKGQRGWSLIWVAVLMGGLAAVAMAALFSMRYGRNFFAEGLQKVAGQGGIAAVAERAAVLPAAVTPPAAKPLRRCVIDGKTVISDTDCLDRNPTSRTVVVHETRGIEAPKAPRPEPAEAAPQDVRAKMIENATR
jgi:hypothetical protein